jgi:hypothetical protein
VYSTKADAHSTNGSQNTVIGDEEGRYRFLAARDLCNPDCFDGGAVMLDYNDAWAEWWANGCHRNESGDPVLIDEIPPENMMWNELAGCWDYPPTEEDCKEMKERRNCPFIGCCDYPCWEADSDA